jgi:hypothetical protein
MVDLVILGDSWTDDSWNTHDTFATIMAKKNKRKTLNLSRAGAVVLDIFKNLKESYDDVAVSSGTQWIIHVGGNDLFHWVLQNPCLVAYDVWGSKHFFKKKGEEIAQGMFRIVEYIVSVHGARKIMISSNTACYSVPLCRLLGKVYTPFTTKKHMNLITSEVNLVLLRAIQGIQGRHSHVHFTFYNECKACATGMLSWSWDLFHPCRDSHEILASACERDLTTLIGEHIEYFKSLVN